MNLKEISINAGYPYFTQITTFENNAFQLEFIWNSRDERWRFSILDMSNNYLLVNIKIVPLIPLIKRYKISNLFKGEIVGFNIKNEFLNADMDSLGRDFKLFYILEEDIISMKNGQL
jgi:hypothetical protein